MGLARLAPGVAKSERAHSTEPGRVGDLPSPSAAAATRKTNFASTARPIRVRCRDTLFNLPYSGALQGVQGIDEQLSAPSTDAVRRRPVYCRDPFGKATKLHGALWEYLRNKSLNAQELLRRAKTGPEAKPVRLQHWAGRSFATAPSYLRSYQGTRIRQSVLFATATPPTGRRAVRGFFPLRREASPAAGGTTIPERR